MACGVNGTSPNVRVFGKPASAALDLGLDRFEAKPETLQDRGGDAFAVADQPEQDVLGAHEVVAEPARFLASQDDDPSRPFGEPFKHWTPLPLSSTEGAISPVRTASYRS